MQGVRISLVFLALASLFLLYGCSSMEDLKVANRTQQERISQLDSELAAANLRAEQLTQQIATFRNRGTTEADGLKEEIAAMEQAMERKNALIASLQGQLLRGGVTLPVELNTMLQEFAESSKMVTYDPTSGVVKFESDLLFERGSDNVASAAVEAVKSLCNILNSGQGKEFDIIVAGHTDDMPIKKPETKQKHPTNRHLAAHRAISVVSIMEASGVESKRLSNRSFGEYRPVAENKPKKGGNPKNRRVEIYIVPAGM